MHRRTTGANSINMRIIRDYQYVDTDDTNAVAAIGNFDGVHLGHQSVLKKAHSIAKNLNAPMGVVTFEPHPRSYFAPDAPYFRLMSSSAKATRLEKLGVSKLYELNFNAALSKLNPEEFARNVLSEGLKLQHVLVGEDFCFGKDRKGNVKILKDLGADLGFGVSSLELIKDKHGEISSTSIRNLLSEGKPKEAASHLGHWHRIEGPVVGGEQRGRVLGYPTANMELSGLHVPKLGVYAVLIDILDGPYKGSFKGAASIGVRPMFGKNSPNLETYIFDFSGDIYGAQISIALVEYLRPELSFDSVETLVEQMASDCEKAKKMLA